MILPCHCASRFQDNRYGKGKRVHTPTGQAKPPAEQKARCTVCGAVRDRASKDKVAA